MPPKRLFSHPALHWIVLVGGLLLAALLAHTAPGGEQEVKNPYAGDPVAIQQGASSYRAGCAYCHAPDARGNRGPDLTATTLSDAELLAVIARGVPGTEMGPASVPDEEIWTVIAYLRSLGAGASPPLRGDAAAGEKVFFEESNCSLCHMVKGRGGRLGPELSRIGAQRAVRYLEQKIRNPNADLTPELWTVRVVTRDGRRFTGVRRNEDTFSLQLMDPDERLHFLLKKDLREVSYEKKSLMPAYDGSLLDSKQLEDLLAYLASLRQRR